MDVQMFFNPSCSTCKTVRGILEERGLDIDFVRYLEQTPTRAQLEDVMGLLGVDDPRAMMRTKEPEYAELGLADAGRDELLDAMLEHPILIQRPIVIHEGRAIIGRPPERVLELFDREYGGPSPQPTCVDGPPSTSALAPRNAQILPARTSRDARGTGWSL